MPVVGMQEIQELELRMLKDTIAVLDAHDIRYYGLYGTALGAVRHNGAIPWDHDVDLGIPYSHYQRMVSRLRDHLGPEYNVPHYDIAEPYYFLFARVAYASVSHAHLHIDLFPLTGAPDTSEEQRDFFNAFREIYRFHPMKKKKPVWGRTPLRRRVKQVLNNTRQWFYRKNTLQLEKEYELLCSSVPYNTAQYIYTACPEDELTQAFIPSQWLGEGVMKPYHDCMLRIPTEYEQYLSFYYGAYTEYPPTEEQEEGLNFTLDLPQHILDLLN